MTITRRLYVRFRQLIQEVAKFGVIGAVAFVVTTVGFNLLHFKAGVGPLTSTTIATVVATFVSYAGNRYWTFRHRDGSRISREYTIFFVLNGIGLLIQLACVGFTQYVLGYNEKLPLNIALILGIGLGTLFRFWSYRKWVWLAPPSDDGPARATIGPAGPGAPEQAGDAPDGSRVPDDSRPAPDLLHAGAARQAPRRAGSGTPAS